MKDQRKRVDSGYAWIVMACTMLLNILWTGSFASFGVLFLGFVEHFQVSKTVVSWIVAFKLGTMGVTGLIVGPLVKMFGCRKVVVISAVLICSGYCCSVFSHTVAVMYLTYGFLPGVGYGSYMVCAPVAVQQYFDKRRSLAVGVTMTGISVGAFGWPPLAAFLHDRYGWRGAVLIMASIQLHGVILGLLLRPPPSIENISLGVDHSEGTDMVLNEVGPSLGSCNKHDRQSLDLGQDEICESENMEKAVDDGSKHDEASDGLVGFELKPDLNLKTFESSKAKYVQNNEQTPFLPSPNTAENIAGVTKMSKPYPSDSDNSEKWDERTYPSNLVAHEETTQQIQRQTDSIGTLSTEVRGPPNRMTTFSHFCTSLIDFSLFKNTPFLMYCIGVFLQKMGHFLVFTFLPVRGVHVGIDTQTSSYLMSILGVCSGVGRLVFGAVADKLGPWRIYLNGSFSAVSGCLTALSAALNTYTGLAIYAGAYGTCSSIYILLEVICILDLWGRDVLARTTGILMTFIGLSNVVGTPLTGALMDATGSPAVPFLVLGCTQFVGGLLTLAATILQSRAKSRDRP